MKQGFELRSKLTDGLLTGGVLILLNLLLNMLVRPLEHIAGRPGLLVYTVSLMAVGGVCLEQSLSGRKSELAQAAWGAMAGLLVWVVIEVSAWLGGQSMVGETAILSLMLVFLVVIVLQRHTRLVGLRYFTYVALAGWLGHLAVQGLTLLGQFAPQLGLTLPMLGYLGAAGLAVAVGYTFLSARSRQERLNAAVMIWFAAMVMIYSFQGGLL